MTNMPLVEGDDPDLPTVEDLADLQGWTDTTLLDLCLTWIDNEADKAAFLGWLVKVAHEENMASE